MNSRSELKPWTPANIPSLVRKVASLKLLMNCVPKKEKSICGEWSTTRQYEKCLDVNSQTKTCVKYSTWGGVHWDRLFFPSCNLWWSSFVLQPNKISTLNLVKQKKHTCLLSFLGGIFSQLVNLRTVACESETSGTSWKIPSWIASTCPEIGHTNWRRDQNRNVLFTCA